MKKLIISASFTFVVVNAAMAYNNSLDLETDIRRIQRNQEAVIWQNQQHLMNQRQAIQNQQNIIENQRKLKSQQAQQIYLQQQQLLLAEEELARRAEAEQAERDRQERVERERRAEQERIVQQQQFIESARAAQLERQLKSHSKGVYIIRNMNGSGMELDGGGEYNLNSMPDWHAGDRIEVFYFPNGGYVFRREKDGSAASGEPKMSLF